MDPIHETVIGVISDTHGLLRPSAREALRGVSQIIHAGDVGDPDILTQLNELAPVTAVRGNCDTGEWALQLPLTATVKIADVTLFVLHDLNDLHLAPTAYSHHAVITGHTHKPLVKHANGVLYLNPGSAGPRRFRLPISLALLRVQSSHLQPDLITLDA